VHAYVINLARSVARRSHITAELEKTGIDFEIVTAVDGRELDLHDTANIDPLFLQVLHPAGAAGCALSHLNVYQKIIADGLDAALVLEDDIVVPPDLASLAEAAAEQLTGAEIALLSFDSAEPRAVAVSSEGIVRLSPGQLLALPIDVAQPRSAAAYVITREACERMVKGAIPIRTLADAWCQFYREGLLDRVRCIVPLSVHKSGEHASTIGFYSLGNGVKARLAEPLVRREIPVLRQVLSYRRQRIYRHFSRSEVVTTPFIEKPSRLD
jgi:glycosyl transferase family 25